MTPQKPTQACKRLVEENLFFSVCLSLSFWFVCILQTHSFMAITEVVDELMTKRLCIQEVLLSEKKVLVPEGPHPPLHCSGSLGSLQMPSLGPARGD